jgi:hypothetical protein
MMWPTVVTAVTTSVPWKDRDIVSDSQRVLPGLLKIVLRVLLVVIARVIGVLSVVIARVLGQGRFLGVVIARAIRVLSVVIARVLLRQRRKTATSVRNAPHVSSGSCQLRSQELYECSRLQLPEWQDSTNRTESHTTIARAVENW